MKRRDILFNTDWDEFDMGICKLFVPFFNQYIPFVFFQNHEPSPKLTDKMILSLNQILDLDEKLQDFYFETFGQENEQKVQEVHIDYDNDRFEGIYSEVILHSIEGEYVSLVFKDGKMVYIDREGSYLDTLVED